MNEYKTTRIWIKTLQNLKRVAAETGETIVALIDRLASVELEKIRDQKKDSDNAAS